MTISSIHHHHILSGIQLLISPDILNVYSYSPSFDLPLIMIMLNYAEPVPRISFVAQIFKPYVSIGVLQ